MPKNIPSDSSNSSMPLNSLNSLNSLNTAGIANKTYASILALVFGVLGIHLWYLKKPIWQIAAYAAAFLVSIPAFIHLIQTSWVYGWAWYVSFFGVLSWCAACLSAMVYALMPAHKWLAYTDTNTSTNTSRRTSMHTDTDLYIPNKNISENADVQVKTTAAGVFTAILALMLSTGSLMAYLALAFQRYFESV